MKKNSFLFSIFFFLSSASAADAPNWKDIVLPSPKSGITNLVQVVQTIINWLLIFGGALAVIAIVYSGILYITSGADATRAETAKKNLIWAIIGIVVILLAYMIINEIGRILGG